MSMHVILFGLSSLGLSLAEQLSKFHCEILAVDNDERKRNEKRPFYLDCILGDATNKTFLKELDIAPDDVCLVTLGGSFRSSLQCVDALSSLGLKRIVAQAKDDCQRKFLTLAGASKILCPEKDFIKIMAHRILEDSVSDSTLLYNEQSFFEREIPASWIGESALSLDVRKRYHVNVIGVKRNEKFLPLIRADMLFEKGDILVSLGSLRTVFDRAEQ